MKEKQPPNTACTRQVGVCAFLGSLRGLELVPAKRRYLVPPTAGNASRWAVPSKTKSVKSKNQRSFASHYYSASCAPATKVVLIETTVPTSTFTPAPTDTATITPAFAPENLTDAKGLSKWVDVNVHAYECKVMVNDVEMNANQ